MRDDYEERIKNDWDYTYKQWDAADDKRRVERDHEITKHALEGERLGREIDRAKHAAELDRVRHNIDAQIQSMRNLKESTRRDISRCPGLRPGLLGTFHQVEWLEDLEKIDVTRAEADTELAVLREKVRVVLAALRERVRAFDPFKSQGIGNAADSIFSNAGLDLKALLPKSPRLDSVQLKLQLELNAQETWLSSIESEVNSLISRREALESTKRLYETLRSRS